jgi:hypothetical protein
VTLLAIFTLPTFIYNELKFRFRNEFLLAVMSLDSADYGVQLRQDYVTDNHQELVAVGNLVEKNISEAIVHIDKAQSYNKQQNIIVNLLSPKYKIYHEKKIDAVGGYENIANEYLDRKRKEHLSSDTLSLVFQTQQKIRNIGNEEDWWNTIDTLPKVVQIIRSNSEELHEGSVIDDDVYNYGRYPKF